MTYPYRTHQENILLLDHFEEIHKTFKTSLGKMSKSRKWAVWQLQGAQLGIAYRAIKYQEERKDLPAIMMTARLSREYLAQVNYFADPNTKAEAIRVLWKVYMPTRYSYPAKLEDINYTGFKKRPHSHTSRRPQPPGIDFSLGKYHKELNDLLSLWTHPSYNLTRELFETDKNKGERYLHLYEYKELFYSDDLAGLVVGEIVEQAGHALHLGSYLFGDVISLEQLKIASKSYF